MLQAGIATASVAEWLVWKVGCPSIGDSWRSAGWTHRLQMPNLLSPRGGSATASGVRMVK
jgi:hypothetical protein